MTPDALIAAAVAWRDQDPDAETRDELDAIITDARADRATALDELRDRFGSRLVFGTAGLRGVLGAGPNRMNRVLVGQAAAGLAAFLRARETMPSIVIGYDGRKNSAIFARDTAEIMAGAGVRTMLMPRHLPTPVLAFAVRHLSTSAGVMVTASHNPASDNGYKVYLGGMDHGAQIVPPSDAAIAADIDLVAQTAVLGDIPRSTGYLTCDENLVEAYIAETAEAGAAHAPVSFVYSAMHGVGWETAHRVFVAAGFGEPGRVDAQLEPDPAFPTVAFPNPEEPGALDLTLAKAKQLAADVAIVNDPDADRLAVAVPGPEGEWRRLSGNEVGMLLGWRIAERMQNLDVDHGTFAASIVSSPALAQVARKFNIDYADTLTGFKWISRVGDLAFGYEEALGYLVDPEKVRDKDGISAAVAFLSLVSELKSMGKTVDDHLLEFAERFGAYASGQISIRVTELSEITSVMAALRVAPPRKVGALTVDAVDDFSGGFAGFAPTDMLRIHLGDSARVIVRPSGTEPKLKIYLDAWSVEGSGAKRQEAARATIKALDAGMRKLVTT
ncbi:MAG: phospho-sugar mutase [Salinibacterium sp.]|nr:MAG: phospho-sugar mutase [Salinibacterium sp.]